MFAPPRNLGRGRHLYLPILRTSGLPPHHSLMRYSSISLGVRLPNMEWYRLWACSFTHTILRGSFSLIPNWRHLERGQIWCRLLWCFCRAMLSPLQEKLLPRFDPCPVLIMVSAVLASEYDVFEDARVGYHAEDESCLLFAVWAVDGDFYPHFVLLSGKDYVNIVIRKDIKIKARSA